MAFYRYLVKDNAKFCLKTIHGIMLVQYLKDNQPVFRQSLGGTVTH